MTLERTYSLEDVAEAFGMSTRWVRDKIKLDKVEHLRPGGRTIKFTERQYEAFRQRYTVTPLADESITTGTKKNAR